MVRHLDSEEPKKPSGEGRVTVGCVIGTRPEAIKMAPVIHALQSDPAFVPSVVLTGQHREMVDELLPVFGVRPDLDLDLMRSGQSAGHIVGRVISELTEHWRDRRPGLVLVQGDTGSALGAAMAAYYERIPVGHVEAGLRTFDASQPFPEETNRVLISRLASIHFCPTSANRQNLLAEGIAPDATFVCGNTGIDAFLDLWRSADPKQALNPSRTADGERLVLVTAHRRENVDAVFEGICQALAELAQRRLATRIVFPVHPNPVLRATARRYLEGVSGVELIDPLRYDRFVELMAKATLLVTDSGGIQEEACAVGKPTLVLRNVTERQEGPKNGSVRVIGTRANDIVREATRLLTDEEALGDLSRPSACFGDGLGSQRIVAALRHTLFGKERPVDYEYGLHHRSAGLHRSK